MPNHQVFRLDHRSPQVAAAIQALMFQAYQVEARLLGVDDFVPLKRTSAGIASAQAAFWGLALDEQLVAVTELEADAPGHLHIASLVVHPACFRRELATRLLQHVLDSHSGEITVSTALANHPALRLYAGQGFCEQHCWRTEDGLAMITLLFQRGQSQALQP